MSDEIKIKKKPETDCFAYRKTSSGEKCNALKKLYCTCEEKCSFYKHIVEVDNKALERAIKNYIGTHKEEPIDDKTND